MLAQQPGDAPDPARETRNVAIEDRKLGEEGEKANVERAGQQLFRGLERGGKIDRLAVECIEIGRQEPLGRREEIEELRVALEIEVRPAGVVGGDGRQGEGVGAAGGAEGVEEGKEAASTPDATELSEDRSFI